MTCVAADRLEPQKFFMPLSSEFGIGSILYNTFYRNYCNMSLFRELFGTEKKDYHSKTEFPYLSFLKLVDVCRRAYVTCAALRSTAAPVVGSR